MRILLMVAAFLAALSVTHAKAQEFSADQKTLIKELALEALLENPEIIEQAYHLLQTRRQAQQEATIAEFLASRKPDFVQDPNAPVLGNPDGDVTVVEFFDYNCPYCKRAAEIVDQLLEKDQNVRLVYREWPILSEGSMFAARAALASRRQGKYAEMHKALMSAPRVDESVTIKVAEEVGLDLERLKTDMQAPEVETHIRLSMELAQGLNINGTPTYVVGDAVAPGLIQLDQFTTLVEQARQKSEGN